jgi:prepilin-type N-terminal cleavage/methylation domain-containing protein
MSRTRGFTLVELAIVLNLVLILLLVAYGLFHNYSRLHQDNLMQAELRGNSRRAAYRVFGRSRQGSYQIDPDQQGVRLSGGGQVRFRKPHLLLNGKPLPGSWEAVTIFQREGRLHLDFQVYGPRRYHGPSLWQTFQYEYPPLQPGAPS